MEFVFTEVVSMDLGPFVEVVSMDFQPPPPPSPPPMAAAAAQGDAFHVRGDAYPQHQYLVLVRTSL